MAFGIGDLDEELYRVRALRADPPGQATKGKRRKVFGAALHQFDELTYRCGPGAGGCRLAGADLCAEFPSNFHPASDGKTAAQSGKHVVERGLDCPGSVRIPTVL